MKLERVGGVKCFTKLSELEYLLEELAGTSTTNIYDSEIHVV